MRKELLLDGVWNFGFTENGIESIIPDNVPADAIMCVPGCYEAHKHYFGRQGSGVYRHTVVCGGFVRLRIAALGLRGCVFWDQKKLGICELAFVHEDFYFQAGEHGTHELVIAVENMPHAREEGKMFFEDYDFYGFPGIYDSVTVTELPEFYLDRIQTSTLTLDGDIRIKLIAGGELSENYEIAVHFDGKESSRRILSGTINEFEIRVPNAKIWSPDTPHLHTLKIVLEPEQQQDELEISFGIRTIQAKKAQLLLNGQVLRLVGYNRHDSHPAFGYALPESLMLEDLMLIKDQGANFVRGSHYPQREKFLNLCDRLGILVWEEVLGWNNQFAQYNNPDFCRWQVEEAVAMVRKSANHPSVILWGFLNEVHMPEENSPRPLIKQLVEAIKKEDSSRLVTFAFSTGWVKKGDQCLDLVDVLSFNTYPGWYSSFENPKPLNDVRMTLKELAEWASREELADKPLIVGEIGAEAIYGYHGDYRWSEEYQEELVSLAIREVLENPRYSGIAIWHFADAKSHTTTLGLLNRARGFNSKGMLDEYRRPKLAWRRIADLLREYKFSSLCPVKL